MHTTTGKLILVIEDDPWVFDLLCTAFELHGYRTAGAVSGESALGDVARNPPDLIVLDYRLPGLNGAQLIELLRGYPSTAGTPILVLTGETNTRVFRQCWEAGATAVVTKPFDLTILMNRVAAYLR